MEFLSSKIICSSLLEIEVFLVHKTPALGAFSLTGTDEQSFNTDNVSLQWESYYTRLCT